MWYISLFLFLIIFSGCQSLSPEVDTPDLTFVEECDALTPCPIGTCLYPPEENLNAICVEGDPCSLCDSGRCTLDYATTPARVTCLP